MDNWNVLAAQTSSQAIGRDDLPIKTRLVSKENIEKNPFRKTTCSKQNKADRLRRCLLYIVCLYVIVYIVTIYAVDECAYCPSQQLFIRPRV